MLLNAVIFVLREVLEASLILSVFLALSQLMYLSKAWCVYAVLVGAVGALLYAINLPIVSQLFDGIGQEIINICLYTLIFVCIVIFIAAIKNTRYEGLIKGVMASCLALAIVNEGSEIIIYIDGFMGIPELFTSALVGGAIGAGIGTSIGVFIYYLIVNLSNKKGVSLGLLILVLFSGGMVTQATQLLLQADLISSQLPLWDTSPWVSEHSLFGGILFALMGYEASPTPIQVGVYITSITPVSYTHLTLPTICSV